MSLARRISRGAARLASVAVAVALVSCSVTRRVPEGELLLDRVNVTGDMGGVAASELKSYSRQQPNSRFLGLWRLGLCLYSAVGDSAETRFGNWLERVGQEPVLWDSAATVSTSQRLQRLLVSKGFYDAVVTDTVILTKAKRCEVTYRVAAGQVYRLNELTYQTPDDELGRLVLADTAHAVIKSGDPFDTNMLDKERERITANLRENGYYSFGKDYVYYWRRMEGLEHAVNCTLVVANAMGGGSTRTEMPHRKAIVDSVAYYVEPVISSLDSANIRKGAEKAMPSNVVVDSAVTMHYAGDRQPFTSTLMRSSCFVTPGAAYRLSDVDLMRTRMSSLKAFRQANILFFENDSASSASDSLTHLRCMVMLETAPRQSFGCDIEGTNSSGNLGAAFNVRYTHANVFRGAESLSVKARLATQHQSSVGGKEDFYTIETGIETTLTFPFMVFPKNSLHFYKRHNPKTLFSFSYDYQRRPEFTRNVFATRMTYTWRGSDYASHSLTPIEFNIVRMPTIDGLFADYIKGTYLQYSYTDHFIMSLGYQFTFNQQTVRRNQRGVYFHIGIETAGNVLNLLTQKQNTEDEFKKIWEIRFAQYVRTDAELRYQTSDLWDNRYVARLFAGIGVPYGNSLMLPFEKSYFVGGANSIRAWPVRGLGPGSQAADPALRYHNQTGDIRLEANAEYRFNIISVLEGALFVDAGNIWLLNRSHNASDAVFTRDFYKQIAMGAGLGVRLNFNYFIVRVDAAYKLHDPAELEDKWVVTRRFQPSKINWNFAIGYPF